MELSALAAKQKRIQTWSQFIESEVQEPSLRNRFTSTLDRYRTTLVRAWKAGSISQEDENEMNDLERQLEQLDDEARLTVVGTQKLTTSLKRF
ncbi:MAG: hypothetical protein J0M12_15270 [Deltaproteobacteria bacterium]|nr:hypothetical protein [Deltaproteobacteria bacterium]